MPVYDDLDSSVQDSNPVLLLRIAPGDNNRLFATTDSLPVYLEDSQEDFGYSIFDNQDFFGQDFFDVVFYPEALRFGEVRQTKEISEAELDIEFPLHNEFAQEFTSIYVNDPASVLVWRTHRDSPNEYIVYWQGRVVANTIEQNDTITLKCENLLSTMRRSGLRAKFQRICRHALYSNSCGVNYEDFAEDAFITAFDGDVYTIPHAASKTGGYYRGGILEFGNTFGYISYHVGDQIRLHTPIKGLGAGFDIRLAPGCDLTITMCHVRFDNEINHGGFPFIPDETPYGGGDLFLTSKIR